MLRTVQHEGKCRRSKKFAKKFAKNSEKFCKRELRSSGLALGARLCRAPLAWHWYGMRCAPIPAARPPRRAPAAPPPRAHLCTRPQSAGACCPPGRCGGTARRRTRPAPTCPCRPSPGRPSGCRSARSAPTPRAPPACHCRTRTPASPRGRTSRSCAAETRADGRRRTAEQHRHEHGAYPPPPPSPQPTCRCSGMDIKGGGRSPGACAWREGGGGLREGVDPPPRQQTSEKR